MSLKMSCLLLLPAGLPVLDAGPPQGHSALSGSERAGHKTRVTVYATELPALSVLGSEHPQVLVKFMEGRNEPEALVVIVNPTDPHSLGPGCCS